MKKGKGQKDCSPATGKAGGVEVVQENASQLRGKRLPASSLPHFQPPPETQSQFSQIAKQARRSSRSRIPAQTASDLKRPFSQNRELAAAAGRKGGQSVPSEKRSFSQNRVLAATAGRKTTAHEQAVLVRNYFYRDQTQPLSPLPPSTRVYAANTIGVPFEVALSKVSDRYTLYLCTDRPRFPDFPPELDFSFKESQGQIHVSSEAILRSMTKPVMIVGTQETQSDASCEKVTCILETKYFKTEITLNFRETRLLSLTYTPIGDKQEGRESNEGIVDDAERKRRPYRKREELDDPKSPPNAEVNRPDTLFTVRMDKKLAELVEQFHASSGTSKKDIVDRAIRMFLATQDIDLDR